MTTLFKIVVPSTGHEYVIHTDGTIEGFPEDAHICNFYKVLLAKEKALLRKWIQE